MRRPRSYTFNRSRTSSSLASVARTTAHLCLTRRLGSSALGCPPGACQWASSVRQCQQATAATATAEARDRARAVATAQAQATAQTRSAPRTPVAAPGARPTPRPPTASDGGEASSRTCRDRRRQRLRDPGGGRRVSAARHRDHLWRGAQECGWRVAAAAERDHDWQPVPWLDCRGACWRAGSRGHGFGENKRTHLSAERRR